MLVVLDTNVLVSGLLKEDSPPGKIVEWVLAREIRLAVDERILQEYVEVTARPRLKIPAAKRETIMAFISIASIRIEPVSLGLSPEIVPDLKDLPFAEVAVAAKADALLTGNQRHFAFLPALGVAVLTPTAFIGQFG